MEVCWINVYYHHLSPNIISIISSSSPSLSCYGEESLGVSPMDTFITEFFLYMEGKL